MQWYEPEPARKRANPGMLTPKEWGKLAIYVVVFYGTIALTFYGLWLIIRSSGK